METTEETKRIIAVWVLKKLEQQVTEENIKKVTDAIKVESICISPLDAVNTEN
ncbi:MAG: hypothetical protein WA532_11455 [Candidatus Korobacteraceae bacterium]